MSNQEPGSFWLLLSSGYWDGTISWTFDAIFPNALVTDGNGLIWKNVSAVDLKRGNATVRGGPGVRHVLPIKYPVHVEFLGNSGCGIILIADEDGCWNSGGTFADSQSIEW